jgi:hypothetical protein
MGGSEAYKARNVCNWRVALANILRVPHPSWTLLPGWAISAHFMCPIRESATAADHADWND